MTTAEAAHADYLRTADVALDELTPFPGNAKRGDAGAILESLCSNGQYRSLVVREVEPGRLIVLAGNHTLQALAAHGPGPCGLTIHAGGEERPCALCHGRDWKPVARSEIIACDDVTARRINLADNRISELGSYDDAALLDLIADLYGDLAGTGYTDTDLSDLLAVLETPDTLDDVDEDDVGAVEDAAEDATPAAAQQQTAEPTAAAVPTTTPPGLPPDVPPSMHDPATSQPVAYPPGTVPSAQQPPQTPPRAALILPYLVEDRDEADRLITAAREVLGDVDTPAIVLRALRCLAAVLDSRHSPDATVKVRAVLRAADVDAA